MKKRFAKIIAISNQKGGVGKTTSTFNIGKMLANKGEKVLMVDLDPQASLTIYSALEPFDYANTIATLIDGSSSISDATVHLADNLDIIPSRLELAQTELRMIGMMMRESILRNILSRIKSEYDCIIIDCPPQLSMLTIGALVAADYVLIPVKTDYLAYRGVELLIQTIDDIRPANNNIKIMGVIATLYESRSKDDNEVLSALKEKYDVIATIKKLTAVKKGVYDGQSVDEIDKRSDAVSAYNSVVEKIIEYLQ